MAFKKQGRNGSSTLLPLTAGLWMACWVPGSGMPTCPFGTMLCCVARYQISGERGCSSRPLASWPPTARLHSAWPPWIFSSSPFLLKLNYLNNFLNIYFIFGYAGYSLLHTSLSLVVESRGYSSVLCLSFLVWWRLWLQSMGSRQESFVGSKAWAH